MKIIEGLKTIYMGRTCRILCKYRHCVEGKTHVPPACKALTSFMQDCREFVYNFTPLDRICQVCTSLKVKSAAKRWHLPWPWPCISQQSGKMKVVFSANKAHTSLTEPSARDNVVVLKAFHWNGTARVIARPTAATVAVVALCGQKCWELDQAAPGPVALFEREMCVWL